METPYSRAAVALPLPPPHLNSYTVDPAGIVPQLPIEYPTGVQIFPGRSAIVEGATMP